MDRMARLFNVAYVLLLATPLSNMKFISHIAQISDVDLRKRPNYLNDNTATLFIISILAVLQSKIQKRIMSFKLIFLLYDL